MAHDSRNKGSILNESNSHGPKKYEKWVLLATILGSSMAFIDSTIVNVALPALQDALHASISELQWVIESYALTLASLLIVGGALGDLYGRRFIFLMGVIIFMAASMGCGLASSIMQLILARAVQGIGAALLVPGSLALISASFPEDRRGQAIGTWAGFSAFTAAGGPLVGGWLVEHASWRWIFFLNLPLAIIVIMTALHCIKDSKSSQAQNQKLDILGAILATLGLGALVFGLIEWEKGAVLTITAEIVGLCALIGFYWVEKRTPSPMIPFEIFHSRNFTAANIITFFLYSSLYGVLFFLPLDLIQVHGYTATQAGGALLPLVLLLFLLSRWAGGLVKKVGAKLPLMVGPAVVAMGYALFLVSDLGNSYWSSYFPAAVFLGIGMAISVAPLTTVVMNSVDQDHAGAASGINNAVSRIAGLFAIAIFSLVMTIIFNKNLQSGLKNSTVSAPAQQEIIAQRTRLADIKTPNEDVRWIINHAFYAGYNVILWIAVALSLASSLSAGLFIRKNNSGLSNPSS